MKGKGPLGIPKWGWVGLALLAVAIFIYVKRKSASSVSSSTSPPQGSDASGVDPSQLASDIAAQLAAAMGGTQPQTDPNAYQSPDLAAFLQALAAQEQDFLDQFGQNLTGLTAGGIAPSWYSQPPQWYTQPPSLPGAPANAQTQAGAPGSPYTPSGAYNLGEPIGSFTTLATGPNILSGGYQTGQPVYAQYSPSGGATGGGYGTGGVATFSTETPRATAGSPVYV